MLDGVWEPAFLDALFSHIEPHATVLEVGTWLGAYTVVLARYIVPKGQVIGFEPDPVAFGQCIANLRLNDVTNAFVLPVAISGSSGVATLFTNKRFGNAGSSLLETNPVKEGYEQGRIDVPATSLDDFVRAFRLEPSVVKIDIEGAEDLALAGSPELLAQKHVKLFVEIHHNYLEARGKSGNTVLQALAELGKEIYFLGISSEDRPLGGAPADVGWNAGYAIGDRMDPARKLCAPNFHVLAR